MKRLPTFRSLLLVVVALTQPACGALLQTAVGWNDVETRSVTKQKKVKVQTTPPGAKVFQKNQDGSLTPLGNSPLVDVASYEVVQEVEVPKSRLPLLIGGLLDVAAVVGTVVALNQVDDDSGLSTLGKVYAIGYGGSAAIADLLFPLILPSDEKVIAEKPVNDGRQLRYVAKRDGYESIEDAVQVPWRDQLALALPRRTAPATVDEPTADGGPEALAKRADDGTAPKVGRTPFSATARAPATADRTGDADLDVDFTTGDVTYTEKETVVKRDADGHVVSVESTESSIGTQSKGLALGVQKEKLTRKKAGDGPGGAFMLSLGYTGIFGDASAHQGLMGMTGRIFLGDFPGEEGGGVSTFELTLGGDGVIGGGSGGMRGSLSGKVGLGLLLGSFEPMNPNTLLQGGFIFRLGGFAGAQLAFGNGTDVSPVYGPLIGLEFPTYNPATAKYESFSIFGLILPLPGAFTLSLNMGFTM